MPDPVLIDKNLFLQATFAPAVVSWTRLEGRPRKEDFARSLRAEVRDALWMICRQWQFGEFRAEDAGSAVTARLQVDAGRIDSFAPAGDQGRPFDDRLPLEVCVEREPIPMSLDVRVQIGRHFIRLAGSTWSGTVRSEYLQQYSIDRPLDLEKAAHLESEPHARAYFSAVAGRIVDGEKLLAEIADGRHEIFLSTLAVADTTREALRASAEALASWFARLYSVPGTDARVSWQPPRLEYRFACGVPSPETTGGRVTLEAGAYPGGHLDWYAFDLDAESSLPGSGTVVQDPPISFLPAPIEFAGMPNVRWWQFEDRKTNFGGIRASTTDLALLMLAELALIYANDWILVPYDLAAGSFARLRGVMVTDVFGVRTFVRTAGSRPADAWQHWNVYNLQNANGPSGTSSLLLLPALGDRQEGAPIEAITLTRDEMANMVFAIEETIPGAIGAGVGGAEAARALDRHLHAGAPRVDEHIEETGARIRYVAGTTVPEHWIPFLPVQLSANAGDIRLQRGRMPRTLPNAPTPTVAPRGDILRHGLDLTPPEPYYLEEEEVPSAGTKVVRAFQRTRWYDGRIYVWLGRRKICGRGEGESGLRFDQIDSI